MKDSADWLAWTLQFILGLVVGAVVGVALILRLGIGYSMQFGVFATYLCGAGFVGGALASYHGDRLWLGHSSRIIAPNSVRNSSVSRAASVATGVTGVVLMAAALLIHCRLWP
ncbi:hypothetical protein [Luteolibacter soli]|uniref:GlsB/YeaQ/YmgE family stress response membrane protein n=1 Tax=Luteolibacter soli TaxID=3135280 RepID=A0ABU9ANF5_9BACT